MSKKCIECKEKDKIGHKYCKECKGKMRQKIDRIKRQERILQRKENCEECRKLTSKTKLCSYCSQLIKKKNVNKKKTVDNFFLVRGPISNRRLCSPMGQV